MTDLLAVRGLGVVIGFLIGAAFMAWLGSGPARALFFWEEWKRFKKWLYFRKKEENCWKSLRVALEGDRGNALINRVTGADMAEGRKSYSTLYPEGLLKPDSEPGSVAEELRAGLGADMNYATGDPSCSICHGCGSVKSYSDPSGEIRCICTHRRRSKKPALPVGIPEGTPEADPTGGDDPDLGRQAQAAARSRLPFLDIPGAEADYVLRTAAVTIPAIRQDLECLGVVAFQVNAQMKAALISKPYALSDRRAAWHEEGDPVLFDEFGHLLEGGRDEDKIG